MAESARRASGINASADAVPPRVQWFVVEGEGRSRRMKRWWLTSPSVWHDMQLWRRLDGWTRKLQLDLAPAASERAVGRSAVQCSWGSWSYLVRRGSSLEEFKLANRHVHICPGCDRTNGLGVLWWRGTFRPSDWWMGLAVVT